MDLLTDILRQAGLRRRLLDRTVLAPLTPARFPCDRSMGLHIVLSGRVRVQGEALDAPLTLEAGDVAWMARGCLHELVALDGPGASEGAGGAGATVLSAAYQFWHTPVHPLFADLPPFTVLRAERLSRLNPLALSITLLGEEAAQPGPGSETIVNGLMDVAFTYLLRTLVDEAAADAPGWRRALRSDPVRQAVELMHADPTRAWTLEQLAREVGLSRTALAEKFRDNMGDTPLNYLRGLRMQKAMRMLSETEDTLETVAGEVGYQDAFSFSKVFKRTVGVAPRDFRRADAATRGEAWRF
jgi:AraC-like DNA-binding protein